MEESTITSKKKLIWCDQCKRNSCRKGYPEGKPDYCQALADPEIIPSALARYNVPDTLRIQDAATQVLERQRKSEYGWPRIKENIEFAKGLGVKKVGIAACMSMLGQASEFAKLIRLAGLEPCTVGCMAGGMPNNEIGVPAGRDSPPCNPIIQAEVLNRAGTEFNFIYGLCIGHDTLFIQHSEAPVSVVLVKDRITGNNPGAVLFSSYYREKLWAEYGGVSDNKKL